jgi:hypothetical protein
MREFSFHTSFVTKGLLMGEIQRYTGIAGQTINLTTYGDGGCRYRIELGDLATIRISLAPGQRIQITPHRALDVDLNIEEILPGGVAPIGD